MNNSTQIGNVSTETDLLVIRAEILSHRVQELTEERKAFAIELAQALHDCVLDIFAVRSLTSMSFELWLNRQFDSRYWSVIQNDDKFQALLEAVDLSQEPYFGMESVARRVNDLLLRDGHEYGFNRFFKAAIPLGRRRLSSFWKGNLPTP